LAISIKRGAELVQMSKGNVCSSMN
jgi:hypothetical protein